jgi:cation-transporting ATPase 13A2
MHCALSIQVLHPFYVFQIASIALWSIDDYYYYAFAIALISVSSILSTLIETKRVSRWIQVSVHVSVLIKGRFCRRSRG